MYKFTFLTIKLKIKTSFFINISSVSKTLKSLETLKTLETPKTLETLKLKNASEIIVTVNNNLYKYTRLTEPQPAGFGDTNYILTLWQRQ